MHKRHRYEVGQLFEMRWCEVNVEQCMYVAVCCIHISGYLLDCASVLHGEIYRMTARRMAHRLL